MLYFVIHNQNYLKFKSRLEHQLNENITNYYGAKALKYIENDYQNINSKLDYLFPIKDNQPENIINLAKSLEVTENIGVFRNPSLPVEETFFSSKNNRIRFENIILQKSMELYEHAGENRSDRMRPLGYGLKSHKNLGFGTLCFTYRNVPFNTPLVFWYEYHNWHPLFERKFIQYNNIHVSSIVE